MPAAVRWYIAAVSAAAIGLAVTQLSNGPPIPWSETALFFGLLILADAKPVLLQRVSMSVTFIVAVVAIIQLPPGVVTVLTGLSVIGTLVTGERRAPHKLVFNAVQLALAGGLAAQTYRWLGGGSGIDADRLIQTVLATAAATCVYFLVNTLAVAGAITLSTRGRFGAIWLGNFGWLTATYAAFGASGLILAALYQVVGVLAVPLLLVPLLVARSVFRSYQEVSQAYETTIRAFVSAIEAKDAYIRGHSERVTEYALMIASRIGMRERDLEAFRYSGLLHDVGKLAIRKAILTKPRELDNEEFDEVRRHPVLGAQIVQEIEFLRPSIDGVLYHHERLDGSGYPAGLAGDVVPLRARIMAIADSFDAMTSTRAYRGAKLPEDAIAELRRCAGTQFDPRFVDIFIDELSKEEVLEMPEPRGEHERAAIPHPAG